VHDSCKELSARQANSMRSAGSRCGALCGATGAVGGIEVPLVGISCSMRSICQSDRWYRDLRDSGLSAHRAGISRRRRDSAAECSASTSCWARWNTADLVRQQSARSLAAYCTRAQAGRVDDRPGVGGHSMIAENGAILAETERFKFETQMAIADVDVQRLLGERLRATPTPRGARSPAPKSAVRTPGAGRVDASAP